MISKTLEQPMEHLRKSLFCAVAGLPAVAAVAAGSGDTSGSAGTTGANGTTAKHPADQPDSRPNIVVIMSDDMGYSDIGCYGGIIRTPNLDRLAANGLRYTQFYNTARSCPTRASLLTGLHPHRAGMGHMTDNRGEDGYRGEINRNCVTFGEVLRPAGYGTYAVGKWHVTPFRGADGPKDNWPLQRGFDHFYGTIPGGGSYYDPFGLCSDNTVVSAADDPGYKPEAFYYTDAIADNAIAFIESHDHRHDSQPMFMYIAFTAAHWPMQVPEQYVKPYHGAFDAGWDALRRDKYNDMVARGIIDPRWALSEDPTVEKWADVANKDFETRCMEVYAGMVSNLDHNIGRIVESLRQCGELDNTVIMYLQDNGGCAEDMERTRRRFTVKLPAGADLSPMSPEEFQTRLIPFKSRDGRPMQRGEVMPGDADTYVAYGKSWAHLSNTPFREFKHWVHEGGISTPLIIHWPAGFPHRGEARQRPGQLMDIMATCVELAGAPYPTSHNGNDIHPCAGKSLVPSFIKDAPGDKRPLFWEHEGNRAVRSGRWKLVYKHTNGPRDISADAWELYDMISDRTETNNRANEYPKRVEKLAAMWNRFAAENNVTPWPKQ
jgi:arylsulfatase